MADHGEPKRIGQKTGWGKWLLIARRVETISKKSNYEKTIKKEHDYDFKRGRHSYERQYEVSDLKLLTF